MESMRTVKERESEILKKGEERERLNKVGGGERI